MPIISLGITGTNNIFRDRLERSILKAILEVLPVLL